jgi:hypothetical protein
LPELKRPGRGVDHPPPSSVEVEGKVELYICCPLWASVACSRVNFGPTQLISYHPLTNWDKLLCVMDYSLFFVDITFDKEHPFEISIAARM